MLPRSACLALVTILAFGACGTDDNNEPDRVSGTSPTASQSMSSPAATATPSATPEPSPTEQTGPKLSVQVRGDQVTPNGERIELGVGEALTITFDADRAGELHVHSKPDQVVEFEAGESTQKLIVETPGVVEVEEHDTGHVVAQLEVQ